LKIILSICLIIFAFNLITQYQWSTWIDGVRALVSMGMSLSMLGLLIIGMSWIIRERATGIEIEFQNQAWKRLLGFLYYHYKLHPKLTTGIYVLYSLQVLFFFSYFGNILSAYTKWGDYIWYRNGLGFYSWFDVKYYLYWLAIFVLLSIGVFFALYISKRSKRPIIHKEIIFIGIVGYCMIFWLFDIARGFY